MELTIPPGWSRVLQSPGPALALACGVLALAAACTAHEWLARTTMAERFAQGDLRARVAAARRLATPASGVQADFTQSLPTSIAVETLVQTLQKSAQESGAVLVTVSSEPRAETSQALARLDVSLTLRGSYTAIKSTLAEALGRFPNAVVRQLRIKREGNGAAAGEEECVVQLMLPLRPGS